MSPGLLLLACVLATAAAVAIDVAVHRRRSTALRALASEWRMHYNPGDQLRLAAKVLPCLPVPGAANVRVMDLIYGSDNDRYRYVFSVEYTVGVIGSKRRVVRVATLSEPRERGGGGKVLLSLAPDEGSLLDQYRALEPEQKKESEARDQESPARVTPDSDSRLLTPDS
jgi:hypothetical protein